MSEVKLPEGWCVAKIEDVSAKCSQRIPQSDESFTYVDIGSINRELKVIESPQYLLGETAPSRARKSIEEGDILVSLTRPNLNAVALVTKDYNGQIASTGFEVIKPILVDSRYIFSITRSKHFINEISGAVQGALYPAAKSGDVQKYKLPLPPLAEQKIIADKLDTLLSQLGSTKARLEQIPQILKRFRQAVLAAAVSGKLTEEWRGTTILIDWKKGILKNFIKKPSYGTSAKSHKEGLIPVLRMGNLQSGKLDWSDLVYTSDKNEIEKYKLIAGDILFNRTNSPELVGKTSIYRGERDAIYAGYLIKVQCLDGLNPEYLNYHLNSHIAKQYCHEVKSDGVSQSNINAQKLAAYPLIVPSIEEQAEIVRRVEQLFVYADAIEKQVQNALDRVRNLTQSILAKAFRGELTAQWRVENPDLISGENSAQALLVQIQQQRSSIKTIKRGKGNS
ncbi:restriction endonuclease subunit S [Yersinia ruckeri]|uniref:restriction endonuclease subunit S n=1 Tax=Yersinia ruckeri TaxID=29486 RepID=UPI0020BD91A8|nr:restriction endonuclease subunit S [Yersinia ruckeri]EKN3362663.1 restriction endonuclease subunit S [Yersinia ruckeri]EKN4202189.1 restriction endonuclease subunit S [Yersinia ruckeri]EKN4726817.1 restriction endonuclease subunit S [Yersinia ruckeri]ELV7519447.1 restriction endonuclease subunit S [Yersinia ruckeri]MCW6539078.1 restriction endonuclease subunit S [Yersinia ruckeri]